MKRILNLGIIVIMLIGFQSCKKSDMAENDSPETMENNLKAALTEVISSSVNETGLQDLHGFSIDKYDGLGAAIPLLEGDHHGKGHFRFPPILGCIDVTVNDSAYPKEIIIEYDSSCAYHHDHSISGMIIITISDIMTHAGATKTVEFQNFYIDSVKVELAASYKNLGMNSDSNWVFQCNSNQTITMPDGTFLTQNHEGTIEWLSGFDTFFRNDDVFLKSGSGSVSLNDSLVYSRTITTPLLYDRSCPFIVSGVVELYKDGSTVIIDYGDGTCDNIATVTTNGITEEISLKNYRFKENGEFRKHCNGFGNH